MLRSVCGTAAVAMALCLGCAGMLAQNSHYDYFGSPDPHDAWSPKIAGWQRRERASDGTVLDAVPPVAGPGAVNGEPATTEATEAPEEALRTKYASFRAERKRSVARAFADWVQSEAKGHYVPDGPIDHWATLDETLRNNGDDCDGLELLVFQGLRDLGFRDEEVYRAVVYRPSDGQHHMVTFWFEDRNDPWVIDPTGAMSPGMQRMSKLTDWVPLKVFSETMEYTVRKTHRIAPDASLAVNP
ncbi:MAG: hypothetical protein V3T33_06125 [Myxococcota bacterium]